MLYDADRHEPLQAATWDENRARDTITRIVQVTEDGEREVVETGCL